MFMITRELEPNSTERAKVKRQREHCLSFLEDNGKAMTETRKFSNIHV